MPVELTFFAAKIFNLKETGQFRASAISFLLTMTLSFIGMYFGKLWEQDITFCEKLKRAQHTVMFSILAITISCV